MIRLMIRMLTLSAFLLISYCLVAQKFTVKESQKELFNSAHNVYVTDDDMYIDVTYTMDREKMSTLTIARYDAKMKEKFSKELDITGTAFLGGAYSDKKVHVFLLQPGGDVSQFIIDAETGKREPGSKKIFSVAEGEKMILKNGTSDNDLYRYILVQSNLKKQKRYHFEGIIFSADLKKIMPVSHEPDVPVKDIGEISTVLSDDGTLSLIYGTEADKKSAFDYSIVQFGTAPKNVKIITGLPEGEVRNFAWNAVKEQLHFSALSARKKKSDFSLIVSGNYTPVTGTIDNLKETEIGLAGLSTECSNEVQKMLSGDGIPKEAEYDTSFVLKDGSRIILYDVGKSTIYQSRFAPDPGQGQGKPSFQVNRYFSGNIYVVKIKASGEPAWIRVIAKNQFDSDIKIFLGTVKMMDNKDGVHIFFLDYPELTDPEKFRRTVTNVGMKKGLSLFSVSVTPNGKLNKQEIINEDEFKLSPERSFAVCKNEIFFVSLAVKKANFGLDMLFKRAGYKMGVIAVK